MYVYEHILAYHYHWSLEDIRDLTVQDFWMHLRLCLIHEGVDKEHQARLAGAEIPDEDPGEGGIVNQGEDVKPSDFGLPHKGDHQGTITKQKSQKLLKFKGQVRPVQVKPEDIKQVGIEDWERLKEERKE